MKARVFVLWLLAGLLVGGIVTLMVMRNRVADPLPELKPADFYAARAKWEKNELPNYDIEVQVTGTQGATYRVQVREGKAIAAWRNDKPLLQERTFSTWSVRGMFGTISRDIDHLERRAAGKSEQSTPRLTLRGEFDAKTGYPARYRRIEWGSSVEVSWKVTQFETAKSAKAAAEQSPPQTSPE
ncbi:DUF6174 domain-containing protein [Anatilimnocola floriformis]|uniref:DUF6174 domain-containing protein n=1 Tax=Anatilimnocola floriformis TaxID=2948575 RepID=UPI0020C5883C|nr:DUF6174 domain-containing protein [Anatilimnocola floriformis]